MVSPASSGRVKASPLPVRRWAARRSNSRRDDGCTRALSCDIEGLAKVGGSEATVGHAERGVKRAGVADAARSAKCLALGSVRNVRRIRCTDGGGGVQRSHRCKSLKRKNGCRMRCTQNDTATPKKRKISTTNLDKGHLDKGHLDKGHLDKGHLDKGHLDKGHLDKG